MKVEKERKPPGDERTGRGKSALAYGKDQPRQKGSAEVLSKKQPSLDIVLLGKGRGRRCRGMAGTRWNEVGGARSREADEAQLRQH